MRLGPKTADGRELLDERTRTSRTYLREGGSRVAVLSAAPVNYRDSTGAWQPIDNRLERSSKSGFAHENKANGYELQLPTDLSSQPVQVAAGGQSVSFALKGATGTGTVSGNAKTYRDAVQSTDLRLTAQAEGVKEDLILRNAAAPSTFHYTLETSAGLTPRLDSRGGVDFVDSEGRKKFAFVAPYMYDASGTAAGYSRSVRYSLSRSASGYTLGLSADRAWLQSPARQWPVVIDPTLTFFPDRDCFITGGSSQNTSFCGGPTLDVGWDGTKASRSLLYWDIGSAIPDARDAIVLNAQLSMHLNSKTTSSTAPLTAHRVTNEWFTDATWNKRDGLFNINWTTPGGDFEAAAAGRVASAGATLGWHRWYPTNLVQDWLDGSAANHGILIKQENENVNNVLHFGSSLDSNYPELRVTYHWRTGMRPFYTLESDQLSDRHALHVNPTNGNLVLQADDLQIAGTGLTLGVSRFYNGLAAGKSDFGGREFGGNWVLGTGVDVYLTVFNDGSVGYYAPSGFATRFLRNEDGTFRSPNGIAATLSKDPVAGTYELASHDDGSKQNFRADGMFSSLEDANGNKIEFTYVASNWLSVNNGWKLTQIKDTQGRITSFTYNDSIERLTKITDPTGRTYQYGYNGVGDLTSYTDPAAKVTNYAYNASGLLTRVTDPKGNQTRITYDAATNRVLTVKHVTNNATGAGPTTSYGYGPDPAICDDPAWTGCTVATDPRGNKTKYFYDPHRLVRKVLDALGNSVATTYTAGFNGAQYTSSSGRISKGQYSTDGRENLEASELPTGARTQWKYLGPQASLPSATVDTRNKETAFGYDTRGNLNELTNAAPSQNKAFFSYNSNGTIAQAVDFKGNVTGYGYDAKGNLTSVDNPAPLGDTSYTYDALSRVTSDTDGKGQTTQYEYDALDRNTKITYHGGSTVTFVYDANGFLSSTTDNTGTTTYEVDALNRLTKETLPGAKVNLYSFDDADNLVGFEDAGGRVTYTYDAVNLLSSLTEPDGKQTTFVYNSDHLRTSTCFPNLICQYMEYDHSDRLTRIYSRKTASSDPNITDFSYSFTDPSTGIDTALRHSVTDKAGNKTTYSYDVLGRLEQAVERDSAGSALGVYQYAYDASGNRCAQRITAGSVPAQVQCSDAADGQTTKYVHNQADQMTQAGGTTYQYDLNGNELSSSASRSFGYNTKNQTVSVTPPGGAAISMTYSGIGQTARVAKAAVNYVSSTLGLTREDATSYTRDDEGELVSMRQAGSTSYYLVDGLGSVAALTDSVGNTVATYKYAPFGATVASTGTSANPWRFLGVLGVYFDTSTGLHKMGARYYDSTLGRFTQTDPIPGGSGTAYDYAAQDPINNSDTDGQRTWLNGYRTITLKRDMVVFRVYGSKAGRVGRWVSPTYPRNAVEARAGLSLPPGNSARYYTKLTLPAGTKIRVGRAGPHFGQPGGWRQIKIMGRFSGSWFPRGVVLPPRGGPCRFRCG